VARLPLAVFLRGEESEVESNGECGEDLARCVERFGSGGITLSVVCGVAATLQVRSRMAVAFSVRCCLFLLVPYRRGATRGGNGDCMSVRMLGGAAGLSCCRCEPCVIARFCCCLSGASRPR
jgi:hypothetical protein